MDVNVYVLKQTGRLNAIEEDIKRCIEIVLSRANALISIPPLDIVVMDDPFSTVPEIGIRGYAKNANTIVISINPVSDYFLRFLDQEVKSVIAHEIHHAARMLTIGYGNTLLEALVSEGLADHFDLEINQLSPKPWNIALNQEELMMFNLLAQKEYNNASYNHSEWFFGSKEKNIPRWTGYTLGFSLVGRYLENTGLLPSQLVDTKARVFI